MHQGERIFAVFLGVFGLIWIWKSTELPYLDYYAPGSGFLPLWLGVILVALVALFLWISRGAQTLDALPSNPRRLWSIAGGLAVTVALIEPLGFSVPVTAYLLFLLRRVEAVSWRTSILVSLGTSIVLFCVFRLWLSVPLPRGPWGF